METEKIDARKRDIAMKLRDTGMKNIEVVKIVGVHHCTDLNGILNIKEIRVL